MGNCAGTMNMCIPFNTIESVLSKLTTQSWFGYRAKGANESQQQHLLRHLKRSAVNLTAYLAQTRIKLSELRSLRPGDYLVLDKRIARDLIVQIEGRNKFAGSVGQLRGRRAIRLRRQAEIDEPL